MKKVSRTPAANLPRQPWGALAAAEAALYVARLNQGSRAEEIRSLVGDLRELRKRLEDVIG